MRHAFTGTTTQIPSQTLNLFGRDSQWNPENLLVSTATKVGNWQSGMKKGWLGI